MKDLCVINEHGNHSYFIDSQLRFHSVERYYQTAENCQSLEISQSRILLWAFWSL
jgi:hypothetical protein